MIAEERKKSFKLWSVKASSGIKCNASCSLINKFSMIVAPEYSNRKTFFYSCVSYIRHSKKRFLSSFCFTLPTYPLIRRFYKLMILTRTIPLYVHTSIVPHCNKIWLLKLVHYIRSYPLIRWTYITCLNQLTIHTWTYSNNFPVTFHMKIILQWIKWLWREELEDHRC